MAIDKNTIIRKEENQDKSARMKKKEDERIKALKTFEEQTSMKDKYGLRKDNYLTSKELRAKKVALNTTKVKDNKEDKER